MNLRAILSDSYGFIFLFLVSIISFVLVCNSEWLVDSIWWLAWERVVIPTATIVPTNDTNDNTIYFVTLNHFFLFVNARRVSKLILI